MDARSWSVAVLTFAWAGFQSVPANANPIPDRPHLTLVPTTVYRAAPRRKAYAKTFAATTLLAGASAAAITGNVGLGELIFGAVAGAAATGVHHTFEPEYRAGAQEDLRAFVDNKLKPGLTPNHRFVELGYLTKTGQLIDHAPSREQLEHLEKVLVYRGQGGQPHVALDGKIYMPADGPGGRKEARARIVAALLEKARDLEARGLKRDAAETYRDAGYMTRDWGLYRKADALHPNPYRAPDLEF